VQQDSSAGYLKRVVFTCPDVSDISTASIFKVEELVCVEVGSDTEVNSCVGRFQSYGEMERGTGLPLYQAQSNIKVFFTNSIQQSPS
jgi:hypothetical protein